MNKSVNPNSTRRSEGGLSPELIAAFSRFVKNTRPTYLHRCVHRMMHECILSDEEMDDEYVKRMVYELGELFELLEVMQDHDVNPKQRFLVPEG
jgi:hypothetical protein